MCMSKNLNRIGRYSLKMKPSLEKQPVNGKNTINVTEWRGNSFPHLDGMESSPSEAPLVVRLP